MALQNQPSIYTSSRIPLKLVFFCWVFFTLDFVYGYHFSRLGILPREIYGLLGVFTAPLLHKNVAHIVSNTFPLIVLGVVLFFFYYKSAKRVFYASFFLPSALVWMFARPVKHIGASGLIYSLAFFIVVSGIMRRDLRSLLISITVAIIYSGLLYGLLPTAYLVSWEMHVAGAVVGSALAIIFRNPARI